MRGGIVAIGVAMVVLGILINVSGIGMLAESVSTYGHNGYIDTDLQGMGRIVALVGATALFIGIVVVIAGLLLKSKEGGRKLSDADKEQLIELISETPVEEPTPNICPACRFRWWGIETPHCPRCGAIVDAPPCHRCGGERHLEVDHSILPTGTNYWFCYKCNEMTPVVPPEEKNVIAKILEIAPPKDYDYKDGPLLFEGEEGSCPGDCTHRGVCVWKDKENRDLWVVTPQSSGMCKFYGDPFAEEPDMELARDVILAVESLPPAEEPTCPECGGLGDRLGLKCPKCGRRVQEPPAGEPDRYNCHICGATLCACGHSKEQHDGDGRCLWCTQCCKYVEPPAEEYKTVRCYECGAEFPPSAKRCWRCGNEVK